MYKHFAGHRFNSILPKHTTQAAQGIIRVAGAVAIVIIDERQPINLIIRIYVGVGIVDFHAQPITDLIIIIVVKNNGIAVVNIVSQFLQPITEALFINRIGIIKQSRHSPAGKLLIYHYQTHVICSQSICYLVAKFLFYYDKTLSLSYPSCIFLHFLAKGILSK